MSAVIRSGISDIRKEKEVEEEEMGIKIVLLVVFFAVMVGVGIYSRKHASSVDGFVLGSRSVGPWLTAFAWVVLGRRTKVMTQHLKSKTMPDFFGERYDSKSLKIVASVIVFVFLIPYTASVYNGLSRLFGMAFNIPYSWCVVAMAVFTAVYVILGGYMATAINDFIQGIIMLVGIVAVIAAVLSGQGGFMEAVSKMAGIPSDAAVRAGSTESAGRCYTDISGYMGTASDDRKILCHQG